MRLIRKFQGGILVSIGYILSPLSWWNDTFINLPIAYFFASIFGLINEKFFLPVMVIAYLLTNLAGFVLIHFGARGILEKRKRITKKSILKLIAISLIYTALIVIIVWLGWLKLPTDYFN